MNAEICQAAQTNLFQEVELVEEVVWSWGCWDQVYSLRWAEEGEGAGGCLYSRGEEVVEVAVDWSSAHDPVRPLPPSVGVVEEALPPSACWWCQPQGWWASWALQEAARLYQNSNCTDGRHPVMISDINLMLELNTTLYVLLRNRLVIEWGEGRSTRESGRHRTLDRFRRWTAAST